MNRDPAEACVYASGVPKPERGQENAAVQQKIRPRFPPKDG
ncbi:hypothetical protein [Achromobacter sp. Root83]|jgi:hypothetical protein|nr:hypothetical protein [Achromobacter sp. Root83]